MALLKARSDEVDTIDAKGALLDERAMDLLGAGEFVKFPPCRGIGGEHEQQAAASALEGNDAELHGEQFSILGGMSAAESESRGRRIKVESAVEIGRLAVWAEIVERHGAEFTSAVTVA